MDRETQNRKTCDAHLSLILLKSNYDRSILRLRNSASFPISADSLADSLFVPFYFSMSFQSSRITAVNNYTPPIVSGKPLPILYIQSRPRQSNSANFRNTPDSSNPPHQKILTPSISSTSSRSRRPSSPHFQPIPAPPPQSREPITQRRNQTNAGSRPQRQIRHCPSGRHGPGQNPSRPRKRKAAPADSSKTRASIELSAVPFKPPSFPPSFPAFPLHFLSIAPSQPFPLGSRIPVSLGLSAIAP